MEYLPNSHFKSLRNEELLSGGNPSCDSKRAHFSHLFYASHTSEMKAQHVCEKHFRFKLRKKEERKKSPKKILWEEYVVYNSLDVYFGVC